MDKLTIQAFFDACWHDIAEISFPVKGGASYTVTRLEYFFDYAITQMGKSDHRAVSINWPVILLSDDCDNSWLKFIDDIIPSGASRRYWVTLKGIGDMPILVQNFILLKFGTISPVGNLRVKESVAELEDFVGITPKRFSIDEVTNRDVDFLSYAQSRGAAAGGATGAGGEAPKLLLRCSEDKQVWIDTFQDDENVDDSHYLVKFPRNRKSQIDCDILRAEYHYYHELEAMGLETIPTEGMWLIEGDKYPSLWLPRFDVVVSQEGHVTRTAMESVYSILQEPAGKMLNHIDCIRRLISIINGSSMIEDNAFDVENFVIEWVRRDLLNIIFGNSDNHGRNTSFLKDETGIRLSPIYDFAPMKADFESVIRTITWGEPLESGGDFNFLAIAEAISVFVDRERLLSELKFTAQQLLGLKQRLVNRGIPDSIINMPCFGFDYIEHKLMKWGLL
ncbi:MAG: HipA domain-containing protein [Psychromonas sp.]